MSITKRELEEKIKELRGMKALKEETDNAIKSLEAEVISYMTSHELSEEFTDTAKITYLPQSRTTLDKEKLSEVLKDLTPFEKVTSFNVLRIK